MNYLIKVCIILLYSQSINANNTIENKILFKINDKVFTNIDLEKRIKYIEIINNSDLSSLDDNTEEELINDYISALIFNEYFNIQKIRYKELNNDIEKFHKQSIQKNNKLNNKEIQFFKSNIEIDLKRKKIIENFLNNKKDEILKKSSDLDILYNYNLNYLIFQKDDKLKKYKNIKNIEDFLRNKEELQKSGINYFFKEDDIIDLTIITESLKNQIKNDNKIEISYFNNYVKISSIEKNLESFKGIFVKIVNFNSEIRIRSENLNCSYIKQQSDKIIHKEYEYDRLNQNIKNNLKSINDYIVYENDNSFNYIFLCDIRFDEKILNNINLNKKINSFAKNIENKLLNEYKKIYNFEKLYE